MLFFNIPIPNILNFGDNIVRHHDSRNIALLEPLEITLNNIEDIRVRIGTRIDKEVASGTDMTTAIGLLAVADQSIADAQQAVALATSTVTSDHPHAPYIETEQAYSALNQSKESLNVVLDAIVTAIDQASTTNATTTYAQKRE